MLMKLTFGQFEPQLGNKSENLKNITDIMKQASMQNSDIVLFPELCLTGYFLQDVDHLLTEPIDGPSIQYMQDLCEELNLYTVFSWAELGKDEKIYNSACLISNKGKVIGNYRKIHLYDTEKEVFTPGNKFHVFDTEIGKIGVMICFDLDFPESARILTLQGAEIILIPTNNMEPYQSYQDVYLPSRAMENEVPIALCNRIGRERELVYFGESAAYNSRGKQIIKLDRTVNIIQTIDIPLIEEKDPNLQYKQNRNPGSYIKLIHD